MGWGPQNGGRVGMCKTLTPKKGHLLVPGTLHVKTVEDYRLNAGLCVKVRGRYLLATLRHYDDKP